MAPPTNKELARRLRIMARTANKENVRKTLLQSADRLEKPGHKMTVTNKRAACLYSVWDNRTDKLLCVDLTEKECLEIMGIGHAGFLAAIRRGSGKLRIEKRFADDPEE